MLQKNATSQGEEQSRRHLVLKWKKVKKEIDGETSWVRIIKARLTARVFKELQAFRDDVTTYSGTASEWAQRMVKQHAAQFE